MEVAVRCDRRAAAVLKMFGEAMVVVGQNAKRLRKKL